MSEPVKPGDTYTNEKGVAYKILDKSFCGFVPIGEILDGPNKGLEVILVNAPRKPWSKF